MQSAYESMQAKYERHEQLCDDTLLSLTTSKEKWLDFLNTSSRMYKYNFEEQVMIYAQRPDCKACADFKFWTSPTKMNRHIKRNTNGIVLLDRDSKKLY